MVELMVGVVIAMIVVTIVMQALSVFEGQKRATTGGSDSTINGALALFQIERDARMTGFGLMSPNGLLCRQGTNIYYNGTTISNGAVLPPILITDGGSGVPDQIQFTRGDSAYGLAPTTIIAAMGSASAVVNVAATAGIQQSDLFLVGAPDGSKVCTLMQASVAPVPGGSGYNLSHASSGFLWNPAAPSAAFTNAIAYGVGDVVQGMGDFAIPTYALQCNDNGTPSDTNSCDLVTYNAMTAGAVNWANTNLTHIASQIVDFQAQYGIAAAGDTTGTVTAWVDASGAPWAAPGPADMLRIKAIRVAVVARASKYEKTAVSPSSLVLWPTTASPAGTQKTTTLTAAQQHYRYKVFYQVIPLINMIWANV